MNSANDKTVPLTIGRDIRTSLSRREAMQWVMGAVAATALPDAVTLAQEVGRTAGPQEKAAQIPTGHVAGGYGTDPILVKNYKPGHFWPLTFDEAQKKTARVLSDVILPNDKYGPAASEVGVVEMLDEWISAPYPNQKEDRPTILDGLAWLETESSKRFNKSFAELSEEQHHAICDDICFVPKAKPEFKKAAAFFTRFKSLAAGAYYSTEAGRKAIGYVGNVALEKFDGPPQEVLDRLGVTQTVV